MKATGPTGGASNGTYVHYLVITSVYALTSSDNGRYYSAYIYFERIRIKEGKKKTAKRQKNENQFGEGMPLEDRRNVWVLTGR